MKNTLLICSVVTGLFITSCGSPSAEVNETSTDTTTVSVDTTTTTVDTTVVTDDVSGSSTTN